MANFLKIILLTIFISYNDAARILGVFVLPSKSHYNLGISYMRLLAEAGHDVAVLSPFEWKQPPKNGTLRNFVLKDVKKRIEEEKVNFGPIDSTPNPFVMIPFLNFHIYRLSEMVLEDPTFKELLKEEFDLLVIEDFFYSALKGLSHHFNVPYIGFLPMGSQPWFNKKVANPTPLSYIPEGILGYPTKMTFWQRVKNVIFNVYFDICSSVGEYFQNRLMKKYFPEADLYSISYNASLYFLTSHISLNSPVPLVPSQIEIGGSHVGPAKELPKDIKTVLDEAKDGVIFFSLGSNVESDQVPDAIRDSFLNVFRKLKQKVLWKWEGPLPNKPDNVITQSWYPQRDILAHPNIKLFITHGGLLSTIETVYEGIPVLAIPITADQHMNANNIKEAGYGLVLSVKDINEDSLMRNIDELLNNSKYGDAAKLKSKIFHNRPINPRDAAVFWTNYVLEHKGAPHLRVAGLDLPWYQYHLIDVYLFFSLIIGSVLYSLSLTRKFCLKKKNQKPKNLNKNKKKN